MKKIIFGAMAAAALLACSKEQVLESNQNGNEITYSIETDNQTKAAAVYCQNFLMENFKVHATYDNGSTINKWYYEDVITKASGWAGTTKRYWSVDGTHDFYAVVNGELTKGATPATVPTVADFSPAENVANQLDLLYAVAFDKSRTDQKVTLNFRHALSQVEFRAKNTNEKLHVIVKGVTVGQVPSVGTFTFPTEASDNNFVDHTQKGENPAVTGTWALENTKVDYSVTLSDVAVVKNATNKAVDLTISKDATTGRDFSKSMLLLPTSSISGGTTAWTPAAGETGYDGTYLAVNCQIYNIEGTAFNSASDVMIHNGLAVIPVSFNWKPGKKYIYTFVFGDGNGGYTPGGEPVLAPISYQIHVDDFEKVTDTDINMEQNNN